MDEFKCAHQQVSAEKFEAKFEALVIKYPKAEDYLNVIYDDREQWAEYVSPLTFSVGSWTSRVEGAFLSVLLTAPAFLSPGPCASCSEVFVYHACID